MFQILPSLKTLRLLLLIVFVNGFLCISSLAEGIAKAQGLEKKITISFDKVTLKQALDKIASRASVTIMYSVTKELTETSVSLHVKDKPLKDVLILLLAPYSYSYQVIDEKIVIRHDLPKPQLKPSENKRLLLIRVKGKVTDNKGQALEGATIRIKGENKLAITDKDGAFVLDDVIPNTILQVSFIGYRTKEITVGNDLNYLTIALNLDDSKLDVVNVVSTGYQTLPRERVTGSFAQPLKEMYDSRVATDIISKLDGITSGLLFNRNTTNTQNGQLDLSIRGRSTIFANDQPLIVIDNFPYSGDINNINPNDVENITVLKDAAAASIWGVKAGNGVIVITTKKGKLNQPLSVSFNSNVTVFQKPDLHYNSQYMSSADYIGVEKFLFQKGKYDTDLSNTTSYPFISPVVEILAQQRGGAISSAMASSQIDALGKNDLLNDMSKYLYQRAVNQQYSVNIKGGDTKTSYYFSTGYDNDLPTQKDNKFNRLTVNSNIAFNPIKNLQVAVGLNYNQSNTKTDNTISNVLQGNIYPYAQLADAAGNPLTITKNLNPAFVKVAPSMGYLDWSYAPLTDLGLSDNTTKYGDIRLSPSLKYTVIKGLSLDIKYQYEQYTSNFRDFESQETYTTRNFINQFASVDAKGIVNYNYVPLGGVLSQSLTTVTAYNARGQLNYAGSWSNSEVNAIAGIEQSQAKTDGNTSASVYGYDPKTGNSTAVDLVDYFPLNPGGLSYSPIPNGGGISGALTRLRSYFGNAAYTYAKKYTFSASARIDGSNYFGVSTNLKSVPLWSVGGKWDVDKEQFYHSAWLPVLHLRATYGYNGNLNQNITGVTTFQYYPINSSLTHLPQAYIANVGDPQLRWEKAGIANFGLDFGLKDNWLSGSFEYFVKNGKDIIGNESVAPSVGLTTIEGNFANMKGSGFDIQVTSTNIDGNFKWFTTLLFSHARDKVTTYNAPSIASSLITADGASGNIYPIVGYPVYGVWSYRWAGLDPTNGDPQGYINGKISKDYGTLIQPASKNDLVYNGPARPQYFGSINNRLVYKDFSLNFNISYKFDYFFRKSALNYTNLFNNWLGGNKEYAQRWQKPGDEKVTNVPSMVYPANSSRDVFYQYSDATVVKGDNIRLQDVSLNYTFDKRVYRNLPFNIQVYLYANNIGILWRANKLNLDPDYPTGYPSPKSISLGVKANL
ncbi:TonB-linked outer membrane protein, SusC/RagA family [Mucilaginibacter lappiensis]|uniref:TonB-linked SusC/RagA family outer membrane protein n=1 Tax=Mucilaginibacter lappiensis TaxID=354630 RepID=A0ABR6PDK1_9SPHI|nr:SusC/RagA family TonB-linked outer membrane protein [Mucilaginibacter lappiensis]MBB6107812.1 TonB-linked SusC/RagA family outer membrane protein [Mucilaginibacter lappiensis]SIP96366.1 TonB-linked outer membrane protein, SusC/RagA family [Mucilaginibacter lappiensis]